MVGRDRQGRTGEKKRVRLVWVGWAMGFDELLGPVEAGGNSPSPSPLDSGGFSVIGERSP